MPSERIQRQVDRLLDEAEQAIAGDDWPLAKERAQKALTLDPGSGEARALFDAAERGQAGEESRGRSGRDGPELPAAQLTTGKGTTELPGAFASGRYQVKRFLGEGGKKQVYLAHDTLLDRDVAFALIKTAGLDDAGRQRIRREAQAMGRLGAHPHIVSVFDLGEERDGQPYLVTELMAGGDMEGLLVRAPEHRLPLDQALRLAAEVCRGLAFAHAHGIVHRDLKPGNVWLTAEGTAKLGDFGLAVALDRSRLTGAGMMVGTVAYMPPEQALGGEVTPQADLYALGAMLYELVCGRPPFVGDESVAIISQHLNTAPVAPSWHNPACPPALETLIVRLLAKDPARRPASAAAVQEALLALTLAPVPAVAVGDSTGAGVPAGADQGPIYQRTFVGREAELHRLRAAFDGALGGQGALALVVGEPGIGKTSLCEQLATYAALRGGRTLVGHCYEEGSLALPYLPFVEALRSYVLARAPERLREELGSGAGEVARIVSEVRERLHVEPSTGGDPEEARYRLLQAVTTFLRTAAGVQPLVVVLEDLHDADRGTLDLLLHLTRHLEGARMLVVGTYRDVEVDRAHPLSAALAELRRAAAFARVLLRGLTAAEVQRMLSSIAGQEVSWGLAEAVHRQTEGNPLFVQEVVRYLAEEGLIKREGGRWRATSTETPLALRIPEGLRDVIGRRLSRLSPACNQVLAVAAVIGREFDLATLRAVAGVGEEALLGALEEAVRVGVLEERSRPGAVRYRFAHAFFRQALYEELIAPRRLRLHQQVARALEAQYAARLEEHAAELAEHFAHSTEAADLAKAVAYGERAAGRALAVYAYGEAARLLEQALGVQEVLDPDDKARRCDLLLALGRALIPAGEPQRVADAIAPEAFALAEALADSHHASRACQMALVALINYGWGSMLGTPAYQQWAQRADQYAAPGSADRVQADIALADVMGARRELNGIWDLRGRALALARELGDPETLFAAAYEIINWRWAPQYEQERFRLAQEFVSRPRDGVSARTLCRLLLRSGHTFLCWGERERAEELWRQMEELAGRSRDAYLLLFPLIVEGTLAFVDGQLEAVLATAARLVARGDELGSPVVGRMFAGGSARRPLLYLGRAEEAAAALDELRPPGRVDDPWWLDLWRVVILAYGDRVAEARAALNRYLAAHDVTSEQDETPLQDLVSLFELAVLVSDRDATRALSTRLASTDSLAAADTNLTSPGRHLGAAMALLGEPEHARAYYHQALAAAGKIRFRPEVALTRLGLAELLLAHYPNEQAEALAHLEFAITELREMQMQPALARALGHKGLLKA